MASIKFDITGDNRSIITSLQKIQTEAKKTQDLLSNLMNRVNTKQGQSNIDEMSSSLQTLSQRASQAAKAVSGIKAPSLSGTSAHITETSRSLETLNKNAHDTGSVMDGVTSTVGNFIKGFTAAQLAIQGVNAAIDAVKGSWETLKGFQSANATLSAILGQSPEEMGRLIESAKELGRRTVFTSSQVTQLQIELSKLGFKEQDILDMSNSTLQFAMATGAQLGDAASTTGAALRMFGAATTEADRYTAAMAAATTNSALNFQSISENLATFGPIAHTIGLEIEDVLALQGKLVDAGYQGGVAMTSLRNIFNAINNGKIKGIESVSSLEDFVSKLNNISKQYQGAEGSKRALSDIGARGGAQFLTLMQAAGDAENGILALKDRIVQSEQGALSEMSEKMTSTVDGSLKMLSSAWEGFILEIGNSSLGPIKDGIDKISDLINGLTDLVTGKSWSDLDGGIQLLIGSLGVLIPSFLVYQGYLKAGEANIARQVTAYQMLEAEMTKTAFVTDQNIEANLRKQVSEGKITLAQAQQIQKCIEKIEIQTQELLVQKQSIDADIAKANSLKKLGPEMVKIAEEAEAEAKSELDEMNARIANGEKIDEETQKLKKLNYEKAKGNTKNWKEQNDWAQSVDTKQLEADSARIGTNIEKGKEQVDKLKNSTGGFKGAMRGAIGSVLDFGKSLISSPIFWIGATIWAVSNAINYFSNKAHSAELAQEGLNNALEEYNKKADENKSKAQALTSTLNDETASLHEQVKAWRELLEIYDNLGVSRTEFQNMTQEEQKKVIEQAQNQKDEEHFKNLQSAFNELQELYKQYDSILLTTMSDATILENGLDKIKDKFHLTDEEVSKLKESLKNGIDGEEFLRSWGSSISDKMRTTISDNAIAGFEEAAKKLNNNTSLSDAVKKSMSDIRGIYVDLLSGKKGNKDAEKELISFADSYGKIIDGLHSKLGETTDKVQREKIAAQIDQYTQLTNMIENLSTLLGQGPLSKDTKEVFDIQLNIRVSEETETMLGKVYDDVYDKSDELKIKILDVMEQAQMSGKDVSSEIVRLLGDDLDAFYENCENEKAKLNQWLKEVNSELNRANLDPSRKQQLELDKSKVEQAIADVDGKIHSLKRVVENPMTSYVEFITVADTSRLPGWLKQILEGKKGLIDLMGLGGAYEKAFSNQKVKPNDTTPTGGGGKKEPTEEEKRAAEKAKAEAEKKAAAAKKAAEDAQRKAEEARKKAQDEARKKAEEANQKRKTLEENAVKAEEEAAKLSREARASAEELRIAQIEDAGEREREQIEENYRLAIEKIEEKEREFRKRNLEEKQRTWEANHKNDKQRNYYDTEEYKNYRKDEKTIILSADQQKVINNERALADKEHKDKLKEFEKQELESMREYWQKYGSFMQKVKATEADYDERIKNARTKGEEGILKKEREEALRTLSLDNLTNGIDWNSLLTEVGNLPTSVMQPMLDRLKAYAETEEYKESSVEDKKEVADLIQQLQSFLGTDMTVSWQDLGQSMDRFSKAVEEYETAKKIEETRYEQAKNAKAEYEADKDNEQKKKAYENAQRLAEEASKQTVTAQKSMEQAQQNVTYQSEQILERTPKWLADLNNNKALQAMNAGDVTGQLSDMQGLQNTINGILPTLGEGMAQQLGSTMSGVLGNVTSGIGGAISSVMSSGIGQMVGIIAQLPRMILDFAKAVKDYVTGILDSITELLKFEWLDDLVTSILNAIGNLINAIFDLPENLFNSLKRIFTEGLAKLIETIVGRVGNVVTGGLISSKDPFGWGDNNKEMQKKIDKLNQHSESLAMAMSSLERSFERAYGMTAVNEAELMKTLITNQQKDASEAMIAEANKHGWMRASLNKSVQDNAAWKDAMAIVSTLLGKEVSSSKEFLRLSGAEMQQIIDLDQGETWNRILQEYRNEGGKHGKSDQLPGMLNDYVNKFATALDDVADDVKEKLTQTTFDGLRDEFVSTLMDMDADAETFSENFSEHLMKAMLTNKIGEMMEKDLREFYEKWYEYSESGGRLTSGEIDALKNQYNGIVEDGLRMRDELAQITGYDQSTSASGTSKGVQGMTQDTAEELNGRFTALQISNESINQQMAVAVSQLMLMGNFTVESNTILSDLRAVAISSNSYLADIAKYNKSIYVDFSEKLDKVINNTNRL